MRPADRPEYSAPPVVEVAMGLKFDRLRRFRQAHFGLFWAALRDDYPATVDRPKKQNLPLPLDGAAPGLHIEMADSAPTDLAWFSSVDNTRLLQLQDDMLLLNWRKTGSSATYPRFNELEPEFWRAWTVLEGVADDPLVPIEVEVTYVNQIPSPDTSFLATFDASRQDAMGDLERVAQRNSATYKAPSVGEHAYLTVETTQGSHGGAPHYLMSLSLRCLVDATGSVKEELAPVLERASDLITRRFTAMTTPTWHERWKRSI